MISERENNMYCKHCGREIPKESKYCRHCGKLVINTHEAQSVTEHKERENTHEKIMYAGFWVRLGAYIADLSGIFLISFLVGFALYVFLDESTADSLINSTPDFIYGYIAYAIYNTISLSIFSTTLGKYIYGLNVTSENNDSLTFGYSLKRSLLQPLSTLFFGVGYWSMEKNPKNQAWHDKSAHTVVTKKKTNLVVAYIITIVSALFWIYLSTLE